MRSIALASVAVPTVERGLAPIRSWSTRIAVVRPSSRSTSGRASDGMKPCTKALYVSLISRWDSAAIVSNTSELLPEPETPVNTVSRRFGISTLTSLRLFTRAPSTRIRSWLSAARGAGAMLRPAASARHRQRHARGLVLRDRQRRCRGLGSRRHLQLDRSLGDDAARRVADALAGRVVRVDQHQRRARVRVLAQRHRQRHLADQRHVELVGQLLAAALAEDRVALPAGRDEARHVLHDARQLEVDLG